MVACYSLNGIDTFIDGKTHVPCNITAVSSGGHSACCPIGDDCLTNGMCKKKNSDNNWYMRRACTDREWKDPACRRYCASIEPERNTGLIFRCFEKDAWCCPYVGVDGLDGWSSRERTNTSCCNDKDLKFTAEEPIKYTVAEGPPKPSTTSLDTSTSAMTSDLADLPTGMSNSTHEVALSQEASSSGLSPGAKIGLGVGIPVGILALTAIVAFIWTRRKKQSTGVNNLPEVYVDTENKGTTTHQHGAEMYRHELPSPVVAAELPVHLEPIELPEQTSPSQWRR